MFAHTISDFSTVDGATIYSKLKKWVLPLKCCSHWLGPAFTPEPQMCKKHRTVNFSMCQFGQKNVKNKNYKQACVCLFWRFSSEFNGPTGNEKNGGWAQKSCNQERQKTRKAVDEWVRERRKQDRSKWEAYFTGWGGRKDELDVWKD